MNFVCITIKTLVNNESNFMEEHSLGKSLSLKESAQTVKNSSRGAKKRCTSSRLCFSFMEISVDPSMKSLKHLDSDKLKEGIKKWAKAVATYARQVSQRLGSSWRSDSRWMKGHDPVWSFKRFKSWSNENNLLVFHSSHILPKNLHWSFFTQ